MMNRNRKPEWQGDLPTVRPKSDDEMGVVRQTRHYKVITPLFGGGVETQKADPVTTVRATEVRGHLRFWWRATRGGQFKGELADMKKVEEAIWGSAAAKGKSGPSSVNLQVITTNAGTCRSPNTDSIESYVRISNDSFESIRAGVEFELRLSYPAKLEKPFEHIDVRTEVDAAIWAWQTFGGIGARTRRGAGALQCLEVNRKAIKLLPAERMKGHIKDNLRKYVTEGAWPENVPHLVREGLQYRVLTNSNWSATTAWHHLIMKLREFRQRRHGKKGYGRSLWPEPEAIRDLTRSTAKKPAPRIVNVDKFPRSAFGLPIVFDMRHDRGQPKYTLQGFGYERLASPVILRPITCTNGEAVGLALVLKSVKLPPQVELKDYGQVNASLSASEVKRIEPLNDNRDVLQAFLNSL